MPRHLSLDALRILSLAGIITLHAAGGGFHDNKPLAFVLDELSRFAVPVFFLLSAWFWKPEELASPWRLTRRVAARVLPAYLFWAAVMIGMTAELPDLSPGGLLLLVWSGGPAFHLWFLPALVVATALVALALKYLGWRWSIGLSLALFVAGTLVGAYAAPIFGHGFPFWVDRNGLFFGPIFLTFGVLLRQNLDRFVGIPTWSILAATVIFALAQVAEGYVIVGRYPMGHDYSLSTLGYATAMLLLFTRLNLHSRLWATFGKATFTAYLVHPLVLQTLVMEWKVPNTLIVIALCVPMTLSLGYTWQLIRAKLTASSKRPTSD